MFLHWPTKYSNPSVGILGIISVGILGYNPVHVFHTSSVRSTEKWPLDFDSCHPDKKEQEAFNPRLSTAVAKDTSMGSFFSEFGAACCGCPASKLLDKVFMEDVAVTLLFVRNISKKWQRLWRVNILKSKKYWRIPTIQKWWTQLWCSEMCSTPPWLCLLLNHLHINTDIDASPSWSAVFGWLSGVCRFDVGQEPKAMSHPAPVPKRFHESASCHAIKMRIKTQNIWRCNITPVLANKNNAKWLIGPKQMQKKIGATE